MRYTNVQHIGLDSTEMIRGAYYLLLLLLNNDYSDVRQL